ncbi:uncharacterized protein PADG_06902 [Paracoccidioides brasiliensis Pb18]|uniref:DUF4604 domain-containing protein n=2 Tax=Paracoccidioides brasiliensis TaxID=121759 RepID=C1GI16_PARBD|nr:uncharacterized protein PADG_06902 [Paracoccidioides brasiliensis Pb18]EEH50823.1 hypothetical protein PADG_06902 [Paracoccidioides brasiliensis Pb18]ODH38323.1 hypothetical protein ACO22_02424 [Paracoccidioides brasiliensis]ODH46822.1 hypothetical protein GX48_07084 [Paracoccidioides brasiliensis]
MSFNAKHLTYDKREPAFLRKLRSEYDNGSCVRNNRPKPFPTKKRDADDDDAPTYVDEDSNEVISKEEYEALVRRNDDNKIVENSRNNREDASDQAKSPQVETNGEAPVEPQGSMTKQKQQVVEIGGTKKRKQGKVIGQEATGEDAKKPQALRKPKQKKKIKLSFNDGD